MSDLDQVISAIESQDLNHAKAFFPRVISDYPFSMPSRLTRGIQESPLFTILQTCFEQFAILKKPSKQEQLNKIMSYFFTALKPSLEAGCIVNLFLYCLSVSRHKISSDSTADVLARIKKIFFSIFDAQTVANDRGCLQGIDGACLCVAASRGRQDICEKIIAENPDALAYRNQWNQPPKQTEYNWLPICYAVESENVALVRFFVERQKYSPAFMYAMVEWPAFICAAVQGNMEIMEVLLEYETRVSNGENWLLRECPAYTRLFGVHDPKGGGFKYHDFVHNYSFVMAIFLGKSTEAVAWLIEKEPRLLESRFWPENCHPFVLIHEKEQAMRECVLAKMRQYLPADECERLCEEAEKLRDPFPRRDVEVEATAAAVAAPLPLKEMMLSAINQENFWDFKKYLNHYLNKYASNMSPDDFSGTFVTLVQASFQQLIVAKSKRAVIDIIWILFAEVTRAEYDFYFVGTFLALSIVVHKTFVEADRVDELAASLEEFKKLFLELFPDVPPDNHNNTIHLAMLYIAAMCKSQALCRRLQNIDSWQDTILQAAGEKNKAIILFLLECATPEIFNSLAENLVLLHQISTVCPEVYEPAYLAEHENFRLASQAMRPAQAAEVTLEEQWMQAYRRNELEKFVEAHDVNESLNEQGETILLKSIANKDTKFFNALLKLNPDLKRANTQGRHALHYALTANSKMTEEICSRAPELMFVADQENITPWDMALKSDHYKVLVPYCDQDSFLTRLMSAEGTARNRLIMARGEREYFAEMLSTDHVALFRFYLDNRKDSWTNAELLQVLRSGAIKILGLMRAEFLKLHEGETLLTHAINSGLSLDEIKKITGVFPQLRGTPNQSGNYPCHCAALKQDQELLKVVTVDINQKTEKTQETALHIATRARNKKSVENILNESANVNEQDAQGSTALHVAAEMAHVEIAQLLLQQSGIALNQVNRKKCTAFMLAIAKEHWPTIECFRQVLSRSDLYQVLAKKIQESTIRPVVMKLVRSVQTDFLDECLSRDASAVFCAIYEKVLAKTDLNSKLGYELIFKAAKAGALEVFKFLSTRPGFSLAFNDPTENCSPLYAAVKEGRLEIVKYLFMHAPHHLTAEIIDQPAKCATENALAVPQQRNLEMSALFKRYQLSEIASPAPAPVSVEKADDAKPVVAVIGKAKVDEPKAIVVASVAAGPAEPRVLGNITAVDFKKRESIREQLGIWYAIQRHRNGLLHTNCSEILLQDADANREYITYHFLRLMESLTQALQQKETKGLRNAARHIYTNFIEQKYTEILALLSSCEDLAIEAYIQALKIAHDADQSIAVPLFAKDAIDGFLQRLRPFCEEAVKYLKQERKAKILPADKYMLQIRSLLKKIHAWTTRSDWVSPLYEVVARAAEGGREGYGYMPHLDILHAMLSRLSQLMRDYKEHYDDRYLQKHWQSEEHKFFWDSCIEMGNVTAHEVTYSATEHFNQAEPVSDNSGWEISLAKVSELLTILRQEDFQEKFTSDFSELVQSPQVAMALAKGQKMPTIQGLAVATEAPATVPQAKNLSTLGVLRRVRQQSQPAEAAPKASGLGRGRLFGQALRQAVGDRGAQPSQQQSGRQPEGRLRAPSVSDPRC